MKPQIRAIYLAVKDMERAVDFYENVLSQKVSSSNKRMSSFDLGNITLLLFDPNADGERVLMGNNVVPNIEVEDLKEMLSLIKELGREIIMPLEKIDKYLIFQVKDTEGNVIEFYQEEKRS